MIESSNNYPLYQNNASDQDGIQYPVTYAGLISRPASLQAPRSLGRRPREEDQTPTLPRLGNLILSGDFGRESYDRHCRIKRHEAIQASLMQYPHATQGFYNHSRIDTQVNNCLMYDPFFAQSIHSGNAPSQYPLGCGPDSSGTGNFARNTNSQVSYPSNVNPSSAPQQPRVDQVRARGNSNGTTSSGR